MILLSQLKHSCTFPVSVAVKYMLMYRNFFENCI